jgi:hypothetical protein
MWRNDEGSNPLLAISRGSYRSLQLLPEPKRVDSPHRVFKRAFCEKIPTLQTCLEFEEQLAKIGLPSEYYVKQNDISTVLQLVHDKSNWMIAFERKGATSTSTLAKTSARNQPTNFQTNIQKNDILSKIWCNFFDDNHDESTREVKNRSHERIFGRKDDTTIFALDWAP